ncbi:Putative ribosomal N-acetyltransferase YdaF [Bdellovibrio bacteriovorus]|uniref:GNAT family N-acetyltransferase n=1 Tax=Bdellovibrio bacteriovorus TaxID=959 RepID=UPI00045BEFCB|nr:GNAT family protein [Bdellovibrio bacteriovorus]AHZ86388.1 ribosomal protein acetyltransferase [Bdellovibrio bacteriovorus]BEV67629.1 Putative ribosomal N-acetyltransferase YdaF [Bdellovibrio bacteriovorus]
MKSVYPAEEIRAERITLKKHKIEMAETMFQYVDQDRERLGRFLPWVPLIGGVHEERDYIEMTQTQWQDFKMFDYGMYLNEGDIYMGNVGVHTISWDNDRCELGYWILGKFEGQGYVREAVLALEKVLFELGFYRIEIHCSGLNSRSSSVAENCHYKFEARLRHHAVENGQRRDTLVFAKLRDER